MDRLFRVARDRADLLVLVVLGVGALALAGAVPAGIYGVGIVAGAGLAMHAIGIVLVYRSNRVVNFAQVQVGLVAALLFRLLVEQRTFLRWLEAVCAPCMERETPRAVAINYWLSLTLSLAVAITLAWLIYTFVAKRFAGAPRLVLTVATVGVAQLLASAQAALPRLLATPQQRELDQLPTGVAAPPSIDLSVRWDPAVFRAPDLLMLVAAAIAVGMLFRFLRSRRGVELQAAAENPDRASTVGINVDAATGRAWLIAGALSGIVGILVAMSAPAGAPAPIDVALTVRILAAAIIASMTSLPIAAAAAVILGVFDQAVLWVSGSGPVTDGVLAGVVLAVLLVQRRRRTRLDEELATAWRAAREARPVPAALRALPEVKRRARLLAIGLVVAVVALPFVMSPRETAVWTTMAIYAIVGLSLLILTGWAGQISLGQFALAGLGAYAASLAGARLGFPMPLALVVGAVTAALAALVVGIPALKMRGLHLAITTLAVALTTSSIVLSPSSLGRHIPEVLDRPALLGIDFESGRLFYFLTVAILCGVALATLGLRRSRFGRALIAARDNEAAVQSFGVNATMLRVTAFAISGAIAGIAGTLFAYHEHGLKPASFTPEISVGVFLMTVIGGLGSISGPVLGAVFLGVLSIAAPGPITVFLATGGGVVALLMLAPGGLAQIAADVRDSILRRTARRAGVHAPPLTGEGSVRERARFAPNRGPDGGEAFVPVRYRVPDQWAVGAGSSADGGARD